MRFSCTDLSVVFASGSRRVTALDRLSIDGRHGEFLTLIGPSGCGKTTLLRVIAGILPPEAGTITFEPEVVAGSGQCLLVYQEDSLFPWMTVLENAAFGLEMKGVPSERRSQLARELLSSYGLGGREKAYPHQISAGMKQRVAVIRAFLSDPEILLMDEPFAALDSPTRIALQTDLVELWRKREKSVVFVTHDVDEAIYLSDRVLVMQPAPGRVIAEVPVALPREGRREAMLSERFLELKREILGHLERCGNEAASKEACHAA